MFALNLLIMLLDAYGTEALAWDAATLDMELRDDFGVDVPAGNFNRLMTAVGLLTSDGFYVSVPDFVQACVALSGHHPTAAMVLPDCEDVAWGITEGVLISPPEDDREKPFSEEIVAFISAVLDDEGILTPPDVLRVSGRANLADRVSYDFSDDPEMFSSIQEVESGKTDAINRTIRGRLRALLQQTKELPLRTGKVAFVERMIEKLPGDDEALPLPG